MSALSAATVSAVMVSPVAFLLAYAVVPQDVVPEMMRMASSVGSIALYLVIFFIS